MDRITSSTTLKDEITVEIIDITLLNPAITQDQLRYLLPMIYLVRAASVTCFAGITSSVFFSLTKEKQDFILSSLINAAVNDEVPSVRSAGCRAIGVITCFLQISQSEQITYQELKLYSAETLQKFIHAVESNTRDPLVLVRITASWALANICDSLRHCISDFSSERHSVGMLNIYYSTFERLVFK
ncbi:hypothetical protein CK203_013728 [Vitis vinifera]|uniref:Uncharacterized protein n=1 Tax=Vitis vinifera TaxID=29760 RepID=A0A438JJG9_VITVI|nr:hypothetical protein CK203_013728 [Vitis vinifera]